MARTTQNLFICDKIYVMSSSERTPLERLFGSKTRAKLLQLFYGNATKSFYIREMTRVVDEQINSVRRELSNLQEIGVVKSETFDNKIYYSANPKHPFYRPLIEIFAVRLDKIPEESLKVDVWEKYTRPVKKYLQAMLMTNRLPGQEGIDLLVIGNDKTKKLTRWAETMEKKMGRPLNFVIMTAEDFSYRKSVKDPFVMDILELETTKLIDPEKIIKER